MKMTPNLRDGSSLNSRSGHLDGVGEAGRESSRVGIRPHCRMQGPAPGVHPRAGWAVVSLGIYGLDRPHGRYVAEVPGGGDRRAVHEPDRRVAAGVAPENVALAVAVVVADLDDRPHGGHGGDTRGRGHRRAAHEPYRGI